MSPPKSINGTLAPEEPMSFFMENPFISCSSVGPSMLGEVLMQSTKRPEAPFWRSAEVYAQTLDEAAQVIRSNTDLLKRQSLRPLAIRIDGKMVDWMTR